MEGVADSTWTAVHNGMRRMVTSTSTFNGLGNFELYGKTGTAQQSKTHPNHGLFVGFTGGQGEKTLHSRSGSRTVIILRILPKSDGILSATITDWMKKMKS